MTTKSLNIEVTSKGTKTVKRELDSIGKSGNNTTSIVDKLNKSFANSAAEQLKSRLKNLNQQYKNGSISLKNYRIEMVSLVRDSKALDKSLSGSTANLGKFNNEAKRSGSILSKITKFASFAVIGATIATAAKSTIQYRDSLSEVSTLLDGDVEQQIGKISELAREQSKQFGGLPTAQVKSFYQIISAGASDATEANIILTASNKLAVGGVTDVTTAADGLTSVLNAYGLEADKSSMITDTLFKGMKAGKTTIGELSSSLGVVAPLAVSAGVSFDELVSSIGALTKGGINTKVAVTGVRAILAAIAKPSSEAAKMAESLGLEFNFAAVQSKGFQGFLEDLKQKTGGSNEALAVLFGGVEALNPILALTGKSSEDFTKIMESMGMKAGATEEAFEKMSNSPGFQIGRLLAAIKVEAINLSDSFVNVLGRSAKFLADNFNTMIRVLKVLGVTLLFAFGPTLVTALGAATTSALAFSAALVANPVGILVTSLGLAIGLLVAFSEKINLTSDGAVTLKDAFVFAFDKILSVLGTVLEKLGDFFSWLNDKYQENKDTINSVLSVIGSITKTSLNLVINSFVGAFNIIKSAWNDFPNFFITLIEISINTGIKLIEKFINFNIQKINQLLKLNIKEVGFEQRDFNKDKESQNISVIKNLGKDTVGKGIESLRPTKPGKGSISKSLSGLIPELPKSISKPLNAGGSSGGGNSENKQLQLTENLNKKYQDQLRIFSVSKEEREKLQKVISLENQFIEKGISLDDKRFKTALSQLNEIENIKKTEKEQSFLSDLNTNFDQELRLFEVAKSERSQLSEIIKLENQFKQKGLAIDTQIFEQAKQRLLENRAIKEQDKQASKQQAFDQGLTKDIEDLQFKISLLSMEKNQREALTITRQLENQAKEQGVNLSQSEIDKMVTLNAQLQKEQELQQFKTSILQSIAGPMDVYNEKMVKLNELLSTGQLSMTEYNSAMGKFREELNQNSESFDSGFNQAMEGMTMTAKDFGSEFANVIGNSFQGVEDNLVSLVTTGEADWKGMVDSMISDIARLIIRMAIIQPLMGGFGGGLGGTSGGGGLLSGIFAKGAAFSGGRVTAFARGGLVNSPTVFPMKKGMGIMGEAGTEAVMPLTRTSSGDLGVRADGLMGGGSSIMFSPVINVTVENDSKDTSGEELGGNIANNIKPMLENMVVQVLQKEKRNGGMLTT